MNTDEDWGLYVSGGTVDIQGAGEFNVTSSAENGVGVFADLGGNATVTSATATGAGGFGALAWGDGSSPTSITLEGDAIGNSYGANACNGAVVTVGGNAQGNTGALADSEPGVGVGGRVEVYGDAIGTGDYGASAIFGGEVIVYGNAQGAYIAAYAERDSRVEVAGEAISTSGISNSAGAYAQEGGVVKVGGKAQGHMGAWANGGRVEVAGEAISTGGGHGAYAQEGGVVTVYGNAQGGARAETGGRIEVAGDAISTGGGHGAYAVSGSLVKVGGNAQGGDYGAWSSGAGSRVEVMCDVTGSFTSVYAAQEAAVHVHGNARLISDSGATTYGVYINNSGGSTPCTVTIDGDLTASAPAAIGVYSVFGGVTTIKGGFSAPAGTAIWLSDAYITAGAAVTVDDKAYLRYSNAGNRVDARVITISATLLYIDRTFNKFVDPPPDVTTTITWNSAHSVTDVMERGISIGPGNYSVTNINGTTATLAIKNAWLMVQPVGIHVLTIEFDEGRRATLTISIIDTRYVASAAIIPAYGTFNRNLTARADVNANITWNAASSVKNVKAGGTSIGAAYYSVSGNTLTIKKEYLVKKPVGQLALTVEFDKGYPAALTINILPENAAIKPSSGTFDKNFPADVATVITWHDASSVTAVKAGGASIGSGFSVSGNTLTIKKEYLTTKPLGSLALTVEFDKGGPAALTITISKSAEISPTAGTFDKTYPADVTTAITWNNASTVTDVKAGGTSIGSGNYSVVGNTLTIKKEYLTTKPLGPLALTVEFDKGGPAELIIAFSQSAAISPASGEYDRNPGAGKDVTTTITWNDARSVTDVTLGETSIGAGGYTMDGTKLTINKDYLASRPVGNLVLSAMFNQGRPAALTIAIIPANAVISPASGAFDKTYPADVDTAITWYDAGSVTGVKAGGTSLGAGSYGVVENTLTINKDYLATQAVGPLALTVEFDKGLPAALTITISKSAEISPTVGTFDKTYPADVTTAITLNNASTVTDVKAGGTSIGSGFSVSGNTLTIKKEYLTTKPLSPLALTVEFDKGGPAELTIAFSKSAAINPASGTFDRNAATQEDVTTNITWNDASSVTDVKLNGTSVEADDYTVRGDTLTINKNCLALRPYGDLVATVEFDKGAPATLAIAVTPENAVLYAITGTFDLIHQSNATASIGWNDAGSVTDVKAADGETSIGSGNYSVVGNTLTIKKEYLATLSVGEVVLTVEFERGASATMTITVIDSPSISPASGTFDRDPDHQADVTTTIYWSYAESVIDVLVLKMMDGVPTWVTLEPVHYVVDVDENTLTIKKEYLATLPVGDAELSVVFNEGAPVPLTITILPENAEISPASGPFDPAEPEDVIAIITLHDAGGVWAVKAGGESLGLGEDYDHEGVASGVSRLIIMKEYLAAQTVGDLVLTVEFEKGASATLTITIIPEAATGTITGTIKDSGKNPVSGANVRLTVSGSVYSATTIEDGSYSMPNVPVGTYTVTAGKSGYTGGSVKGVCVVANATTEVIDIILTPNEDGCVVTYQDAQLIRKAEGTYDIRFIATTNTLDAQEVGFVFSKTQDMPVIGGENVSVKSTNKVYSTVMAGDSTFAAASYGETYIFVCTVTEIPQTDGAMDTPLYVRAFSTIGGVTKYTAPVTVTVNDLL